MLCTQPCWNDQKVADLWPKTVCRFDPKLCQISLSLNEANFIFWKLVPNNSIFQAHYLYKCKFHGQNTSRLKSQNNLNLNSLTINMMFWHKLLKSCGQITLEAEFWFRCLILHNKHLNAQNGEISPILQLRIFYSNTVGLKKMLLFDQGLGKNNQITGLCPSLSFWVYNFDGHNSTFLPNFDEILCAEPADYYSKESGGCCLFASFDFWQEIWCDRHIGTNGSRASILHQESGPLNWRAG